MSVEVDMDLKVMAGALRAFGSGFSAVLAATAILGALVI